jgi:hypothetical protein
MAIHRVTDMARVAPLFAGWPDYLFRAVLEGEMGEAYATLDDTAALLHVADLAFLAGDAASPEAGALVSCMPAGSGGVRFWTPRDEAWAGVIERVLGNRARRAQRYAIRKDVHHFDEARLRSLAARLPEGYSLHAVDGALYRQALAEEWSRDLVSQFRDEADYRARGLGVAVLLNGEIVSGASSFVVFRGGIEIEIDTRGDQRRRGLATACGARLLLDCFARGLYPSWDAYSPASVALAEKLGYVFDHPYPVYEVDGETDGDFA